MNTDEGNWISSITSDRQGKRLELGQGDGHAAGNEIHVSLPAGSQAATAVGMLLHEANGLEVLEDVPDEAT